MLFSLGSETTILLVGVSLSRVLQENIGRPASIFDTEIYYFGLISAMGHTTRSSKELFYAIQTERHTRAF